MLLPNPLMTPIAKILRAHPDGMSEYQLLNQLEFEALQGDVGVGIGSDLLLFRKHFLLMNALYRLQPILWEEGVSLQISALHIQLQARPPEMMTGLPDPAGEQAIRDYYLDWNEFEQSSSASVEQLLHGFWQRYAATDSSSIDSSSIDSSSIDKRLDALALFELESDCSWSEIRRAYRRQAGIHHPDRGGDGERFCRVRDAYELLACSFGY
ncbi:MAG: hypothetical protein ACI9W6_000795 [Motiliproteus sp.]|jgi:hypothetical protein